MLNPSLVTLSEAIDNYSSAMKTKDALRSTMKGAGYKSVITALYDTKTLTDATPATVTTDINFFDGKTTDGVSTPTNSLSTNQIPSNEAWLVYGIQADVLQTEAVKSSYAGGADLDNLLNGAGLTIDVKWRGNLTAFTGTLRDIASRMSIRGFATDAVTVPGNTNATPVTEYRDTYVIAPRVSAAIQPELLEPLAHFTVTGKCKAAQTLVGATYLKVTLLCKIWKLA